MGYIHVEVDSHQVAKKPGASGDVVRVLRTKAATAVICCDGIGSGIKANLAATMATQRLVELLNGGWSLRKSFMQVARSMNRLRGQEVVYPYAVFSVAYILNDGSATILTYESPRPLLISRGHVSTLKLRTEMLGTEVVGETECVLDPGEGVLLMTDGLTQAGIGGRFVEGWSADGVQQCAESLLARRIRPEQLPKCLVDRALAHWGQVQGDDCTALLARCRKGVPVNIFTGPPANPQMDEKTVKRFMDAEGLRIVAGAETARIVSRCTGKELGIEANPSSLITPPKYEIDGIDLVSEGAVTLNQVYNVLDADPAGFEETSAVTEMVELLRLADRVNFLLGTAENPANKSLTFRQQGIVSRGNIVPLIAEKLRDQGKLVVVERV
ncbi:MAG: SpoIIE family protein phosphatase [Phycisphaerae bacterium]